MVSYVGVLIVAVCVVSESSARLRVTLLNRDYSYIKRLLERMTELQVTVPPRIRHLYDLLKKDYKQGPEYGQMHHVLDFNKTLPPRYDVNKLNRIFTTPAMQK
ncbi:uncharacterized protein LOC118276900 isoform X2 [Spodoptera frugiperda]|uniref:Uncharacterized protein LOC118276900 isoform X2 n=1 Tax=Spodoptera frugiperda TaxID=7108 RepID=A0A9R0EQK1_SPOFR|nr:uncharacterized protein LOC118276900 isoform X2 [Spodoptera frugiperda]